MKESQPPARESVIEWHQFIVIGCGALLFLACFVSGAIEQPIATSHEYESKTACDQPYFPLRQGATWRFNWELGSFSWTVTAVSGDLASASATLVSDFEGDIITYNWACSSEGVSYHQIVIVSDAPNFLRSSPSMLPAGGLEAGARWRSEYTINFEGSEARPAIDVRESHSAGGVQSQTTGVGTFQAIPVFTTGTSTYFCDMGGTPCIYNRPHRICWFTYGVGLLRCEFALEGGSARTELVSYHIP